MFRQHRDRNYNNRGNRPSRDTMGDLVTGTGTLEKINTYIEPVPDKVEVGEVEVVKVPYVKYFMFSAAALLILSSISS